MANFDEMSGIKQWAAMVGLALVISAALYFTLFKSQRDANTTAQASLDTKLRENAELESYRPKLAEIERQLMARVQQLRSIEGETDLHEFLNAALSPVLAEFLARARRRLPSGPLRRPRRCGRRFRPIA